jgi:hypothetical protein
MQTVFAYEVKLCDRWELGLLDCGLDQGTGLSAQLILNDN